MTETRTLIPIKLNYILSFFLIGQNIFKFFILPAYFLPLSLTWSLLVFPMIPLNNTLWFLIHESIHKNLNPDRKKNEVIGRVLSIVFGASYHLLMFGHLMHHKLNRSWESEICSKTDLKTKIKYYYYLFFGTYITEIISSTLLFALSRKQVLKIAARKEKNIPGLTGLMDNFFYQKNNIRKLRMDFIFILMFYSLSFITFGKYWPVLLGILGLRALSISLMDNIFHYATPLDNSMPGKQVEASLIASLLLLNGNHHEMHHRRPTIPWIHLPLESLKANMITQEKFRESFLQQFQGPILAKPRNKQVMH